MTQITQNSKTTNSIGQDTQTGSDFRLDTNLLAKRLNALMRHVSDITGSETAEKHAREISVHLKSLKELCVYNTVVKMAEPERKPKYTPEEKMAMAEKLADIIIKNEGTP